MHAAANLIIRGLSVVALGNSDSRLRVGLLFPCALRFHYIHEPALIKHTVRRRLFRLILYRTNTECNRMKLTG